MPNKLSASPVAYWLVLSQITSAPKTAAMAAPASMPAAKPRVSLPVCTTAANPAELAAARAVEEEGAGDEENEREKRAVAVAAGVENGERGGLASSSSPLAPPPPSHPFPIPLSRLWRLVARAQSSLNKPWASAAAWRQAAMLAEDEEGARGDEARATEQDAAAAADAAARYG